MGLDAARRVGPRRGGAGAGFRRRRHGGARVDCAVSRRPESGARASPRRGSVYRIARGSDSTHEHAGAGRAPRHGSPPGVWPGGPGIGAGRYPPGAGGAGSGGAEARGWGRRGGGGGGGGARGGRGGGGGPGGGAPGGG